MKAIYIVCMIALLGAIMVMPAAAGFEPSECDIEVHPGDSLDAKVDSATDGQTVCVYAGTYGWFSLNTPNVTLKGEGADKVTLDCGGTMSAIGNAASASGCVVDGFKIVNSDHGIEVHSGCPNCIIRNCVFESPSMMISLGAINTTFMDNVVSNSTYSSRALDITRNGSTIVNNTIINSVGSAILPYIDAQGPNSVISGNNLISNGNGIWLHSSFVYPGYKIYLNNFVDNTENVKYTGTPATTYWNSTEPIEYTHNGMIHTGHLGNHWDDYTGTDGDGDGIGDTPYDIPPGSPVDYDHHPLMAGFENYLGEEAANPDLTPTSIATDSLSAGVPAAITVNVSNIGSADAGSFNVSLKVEETVIGSDTVASLGAGSSVPVVFTWTPDAAGSFNLTAIVDSDDAVAESDEANNELTREVTVTPAAPPAQFTLSVTVDPEGSGTVDRDPAGGTYDENTVVTLTANPAAGYTFDHWSVDLTGSTNPETLTMDADKNVTAHFAIGKVWSPMLSPTTGLLTGVWGTADSDVFAVGYIEENYQGIIFHYNGTSWSKIYGPGDADTDRWGVWGTADSDVFAVGYIGTIFHYNGTDWSTMTSPTTAWLLGVWGTAGNNIFAMGEGGTIIHYDGTDWSTMTSPTTGDLWGVWGTSGNDVFAVGTAGTILHYDGADWSTMTGPTTEDLNGVWGTTGSDIFAVGTAGTILHYDGADWSTMTGPTTEDLNGVWGTTGSDIFAVGTSGTILRYGPPPPPDLIPTAITEPTARCCVEWPDDIVVTIVNMGEGVGSFDVELYADTELIGTRNVASLAAAGASTDVAFTWTPSATGAFTLKAVVDSGNDVSESNEINNELTKVVQVGTDIVDQECLDTGESSSFGQLQWQEFRPALDNLARVAIRCYIYEPNQTITLKIKKDGEVLTTATRTIAEDNWNGWLIFDVEDITLVPDESYIIEVTGSSGTCGGMYWGGEYPGGAGATGMTGPYNLPGGRGWAFRTYGVPFIPIAEATLAVDPEGSGTVDLDPAGGTYDENTVVTLTANPATGFTFDHWSGDLSGSVNPETLTMDSNKSVTANFVVEAQSTPTSFLISGNITYDNGNPVMNPAVTVTNLATSEDFTVKTDAGSNYYLTLTDSTHITAGEMIRINTSDGSASSETDHPVTASEIETGGFVHDMTIESGDLPDLTVTEKSEEWISLADGTYNVTCTVANIGTSGADASTTAIEIDGTVVATDSVPALVIGESHTSTLGPFTLSGENDTIRVCADSGEIINEQSETNNCLENVLEAPSMPDLIVWVALKTPGYVNEDNILGVRVKNTGTGDAGSFNVSLAIDGTPMPGQTVPPLVAGETTEIEYAWTPTELGGHALSATVDTGNDVEESDETNNDYARTSVIISSTDWAQFNYDASGIGFSPSSAPSSNTVKWISEDIVAGGGLSWGGISDMGPVVADGKIFTYCGVGGVSATTYDVACVNEETGELLWNITLPYPMVYGSWAPLGYDDGMVFCTVNHYVVALDANDGSIVWECDLDSPEFEGHAWSVNSGPTIADGKVFAGTYDDGGIGGEGGLAGYVAIDEYTGEKLWQTTGDGHCDSTPAYYDGVVYAGFDYDWTASPSGGCYALNASTGEEVWTTWLPFSIWGSVSADEDYVYGANYNFYGPAQVFILYRNNGTVKVISESLRTDSTPAVAYGNIYICGGCQGYSDTGTFCVDKETLEVLWSAPAGSWTASPAVADGKVYVGGYCYDAFTGEEIFSYEQGGLSPVIANGYLFNVQNGRVVCFEDSLPDLTVSAIETPVNLRNDVINPITTTIENIGGSATENFDVLLTVDGTTIDTQPSSILAAGENTTIEFLWTPSSTGIQTLTVTADASDAVTESDESNNNLSQTADVLEKLTVTANVRIEGKNDTVWTGDVTFSSSVLTASDGSTHYLNEPTALGALDEADKLGGFGYVLVDYEWGLYVEEVAGEPPIGWDGWMYRVNYISPSFGAPDYTLADNDKVLWYFGIMWPLVPPLAIELSATEVNVGEEFVVTVTAYNGTSAEFEHVNNATVYADGLTFQTGPDGNATLSIDIAGDYMVYADKGTWADYTRSERKSVNVATSVKVDIGDYVVTSGSSIVAPITVYGITDYGTTTIKLEYDSSVAWVTRVDSTPDSTVTSVNINNPAGIVTLSAWNTGGVSGDVVVANVTFEARGPSGGITTLDLTVTTLKDTSYNEIPVYDDDGSFTVKESEPPVVGSPSSSPGVILNDNGRARVPGTNLSTLSVSVTDNAGVASVTIDLTPIGSDSAAEMTHAGGTIWSIEVNATAGANLDHCLVVNATDTSGNSNTGVCIPLTVLIRGDVVRDGDADIVDAYYIARYTVGLEPAPDEFVAGVVLVDSWDGVDIVDAYYIARHSVGLEDAP